MYPGVVPEQPIVDVCRLPPPSPRPAAAKPQWRRRRRHCTSVRPLVVLALAAAAAALAAAVLASWGFEDKEEASRLAATHATLTPIAGSALAFDYVVPRPRGRRAPVVAATAAAAASTRKAMATPAGAHGERMSMHDDEILRNLREVHGWRNTDHGAGGNCLFLAIAPQVTSSDFAGAVARVAPGWDAPAWGAASLLERAHLLRKLAMLEESHFLCRFAALRGERGEVPQAFQWRMLEFYRDMAEEFISSGTTELAKGVNSWDLRGVYRRVRALAVETPVEQIYDFVLTHAGEYMRITGLEGNWAGSSEMAALSSALRRPFAAYGNNWVSQDDLEVEASGGVKPYFMAPVQSEVSDLSEEEGLASTVRIFQKNGGGHYQMLG